MSKHRSISNSLSGSETVAATVYLLVQFLAMPSFLDWCNQHFAFGLAETELNFVFYLINFMAMLLIFHGFLGRNGRQATQHPLLFCEAVILGFVAYYACSWLITQFVDLLLPGFTNYNDESLSSMGDANYFLMFIGTVILVPPFEECMFRGLIFHTLYKRNRVTAYIFSILAFAAVHMTAYIRIYTPLELLMTFLQYLPAGLCLAWSYVRGDTIFAPIAIHAAINFVTMQSVR